MEDLDTVLTANRAYLLGWNAGPAVNDTHLLTYRSGAPHPTLNGVVRVSGHSAQQALDQARQRLQGLPRVWWAGPDSDPGIADGLLQLGATELAALPIMALDIDEATPTDPVPGLSITETADLEELVSAYARVSGIPVEGVATTIEREKAFTADGHLVRLAGRLPDGRIAGTAHCWLSHDVLTLYYIGTQPDQRRRGIGSAMTTAALALGRARGVRTAALTSSAMGEPIYHRLGFRELGTYRLLSF